MIIILPWKLYIYKPGYAKKIRKVFENKSNYEFLKKKTQLLKKIKYVGRQKEIKVLLIFYKEQNNLRTLSFIPYA